MICEECKKPHQNLVEVRVTSYFLDRKNEWLTYFCPQCLDYVQKREEAIKWVKKEKSQ